MTTSNQIALRKVKEEERANKKREQLESRKVRESERQGKFNRAFTFGQGISNLITKTTNDPEWYMLDKALAENAANLSYIPTLGLPTQTEFNKHTYPGIAIIKFMPTIGSSSADIQDSISNIASKNVYAYVRHANSGARNYEAQDLMMYFYSVDQLISYHAMLTRLYSALTHVDASNRYTVKAIVTSMGIKFEDVITHIPELRSYINYLAVNINSLYVPKTLPLLQRHTWLNSQIFKDSDLKKSQLYMFVQAKFGVYNDETGSVEFAPTSMSNQFIPHFNVTSRYTFNQIVDFGNYMLSKLINSEDIGIMSGDILKAYGEGNLVYINNIDADFTVHPTYDINVLSQIHNAVLTNASVDGNAFDIKQTDTGEVYQGLPFYSRSNALNVIKGYGIPCNLGFTQLSDTSDYPTIDNGIYNHILLNMDKDDVSVADNLVATRFAVSGEFGDVSFALPSAQNRPFSGALTVYGTEIAIDMHIAQFYPGAADGIDFYKYTRITLTTNATINASIYTAVYSRFRYAPKICVISEFDDDLISKSDVFNYNLTLSDIGNYTSLSKDTLSRMHQVCILSELGVPNLGMAVRSR